MSSQVPFYLVQKLCALLFVAGPLFTARAQNPEAVTVTLGQPSIVAHAPTGEKRWGHYQFPGLERLSDGRLHVTWTAAEDSAAAYGSPPHSAVSSDEGATWQHLSAEEAETLPGGTPLPGGERLKVLSEKPVPIDSVELPKPAGESVSTYGNLKHVFYIPSDLAEEVRKCWPQARWTSGSASWKREYPRVTVPGQVFTARDGVLARPFFMGLIMPAPDGSLWTSSYWKRLEQEKLTLHNPAFVRSTDQGRTWEFMSAIAYQPDKTADPHCEKRDGFTEPELAFLHDGSILAIMRTTDGIGYAPLYTARSTDGGQSWSKPQVFDSLGVLPQLLVLEDGFTLAAYGRPGVYLKATADRSARSWGPRTEVPLHKPDWSPVEASCGYTRLLPLDGSSALLTYSDFGYPDKDGTPRKTILVRKVSLSRSGPSVK